MIVQESIRPKTARTHDKGNGMISDLINDL